MTLSKDNKSGLPKVSSSSSLAPINKALINEQVSPEWKRCFFKTSNLILNPSYDRLSTILEQNEQSIFFRLTLGSLEGALPGLEVKFLLKFFFFFFKVSLIF